LKKPDWDRIQEIYHEARKLACPERRAFVEEACKGDTVIARDVLDLLALDEESFMEPPVNLPLAPAVDDLVERTISERYFMEKELGSGGMSRVYLARDVRVNGKTVVIKVLSLDLLEHPYARQKFEQEVEALARIHHISVVEVFDKGELPDGRPYFVMEFIDGESLRTHISPNEGMNLEHVASILRQIGSALEHVHQSSVFHRDLKPENIMLRRGTDKIVLIDFGVAKVTDSVIATTTVNGQSAGTLAYMSPEQLRGERLTSASDIYTMGIIAYEMVTGRRPFNPTSPAQLLELQRAGVTVKPVALRPNLPRKAQEVILRGMLFKPASRYQNAKQFGDSLAQALSYSDVGEKKKQWLKPLMTVLVVVLVSFVIYKVIIGNGERPPNRSFNYFLTVQKMHDGQPHKTPIKSHGEEIYESGDKFRLTVSTPVPAFLYIFHEGRTENEISFKMIYPRQATKGAASLGADQSFESEWMTFSGSAGAENFWIVWSTSPVAELESVIGEEFKNSDGALTGQTLVAVKQYLIAKEAEIDATTYNYNANQTAVVRARRDLLVALAQFRHR
jgi:serine/threonine protein kinase